MGAELQRQQEQLKNLNCKAVCPNPCVVTEKELQKLYKNFQKMDKDKSGTLEPEEFFDIPGTWFSAPYLSFVQSWLRTL